MILSKVLIIRNTFIKANCIILSSKCGIFPHLFPTFPHFHAPLFSCGFSYIVDIQ